MSGSLPIPRDHQAQNEVLESFQDPATIRWIIQGMIILLLSIAVHEYGHALVAHKLGDLLPQSQGRVTLNPLAHADPIGTFIFPLVGLLFTGGKGFGFGWGKPVQVVPASFSRRYTIRTGHMFVAFAGPMMNVLFATFIALLLGGLQASGVLSPAHPLSQALHYAISLNFILFFFNLIPAPPLDGGAVLEGLLPDRWVAPYQQVSVYGPFLLMAVILIPTLSRLFILPAVWVHRQLWTLVSALFGLS